MVPETKVQGFCLESGAVAKVLSVKAWSRSEYSFMCFHRLPRIRSFSDFCVLGSVNFISDLPQTRDAKREVDFTCDLMTLVSSTCK